MSLTDTKGVAVFEIENMEFDQEVVGSPEPTITQEEQPVVVDKPKPKMGMGFGKLKSKVTEEPTLPSTAGVTGVIEPKLQETLSFAGKEESNTIADLLVDVAKKRGRPAKGKEEPVATTSELLNKVTEIVNKPNDVVNEAFEVYPEDEIAEMASDSSFSNEEPTQVICNGEVADLLGCVCEETPHYAIINDNGVKLSVVGTVDNPLTDEQTIEYTELINNSNAIANKPDDNVLKLKKRIALSNTPKSQLTEEMKKELTEFQATEQVENSEKYFSSLKDLEQILNNAKQPLDYWENLLDNVQTLKPEPLPINPTPDDIINSLTKLNACFLRISDGYSSLKKVAATYKECIDVLEKMWSVISLQSNEASRKGELLLNLNHIVPYKIQVTNLVIAFETEVSMLMNEMSACKGCIEAIRLNISLSIDPFIKAPDGISM